MDAAERWRRVSQIYSAALAHEGSAREHVLREACAGDETLQREVEAIKTLPDMFSRRPGAARHELENQRACSVWRGFDAIDGANVRMIECRKEAGLAIVDGPTLAERLTNGPLPALPISFEPRQNSNLPRRQRAVVNP